MSTRQHPALPPGWTRVYVQIPSVLAEILRVAAEAEGHGGLKIISTAAIAAFLALPPDQRQAATGHVANITRRDPSSITPEDVARVILEAAPRQETNTHYIDRIADPELTPKPGAKLSDRGAIAKGLRKGA